jgi:hypothetical protein
MRGALEVSGHVVVLTHLDALARMALHSLDCAL